MVAMKRMVLISMLATCCTSRETHLQMAIRARANRCPQFSVRRLHLFTHTMRGGGVDLPKCVLRRSLEKAFAGGLTGSVAGVAQVLTFMWLRTAMNYQYRHGGNLRTVLPLLWGEGGIRRLYRGLPFAIVQGPLSRFGSAAANTLVLGLRDADLFGLGAYPVYVVTFIGSLLTAIYRCLIMPIDTLKTVSQVDGRVGFDAVIRRAFKHRNPSVLYTGAYAMAASTLVGHYPWFLTFNILNSLYPKHDRALYNSVRLVLIGFFSSLVSDVASNPVRVIKTTKQSSVAQISINSEMPRSNRCAGIDSTYVELIKEITQRDGPRALFTRGLSTRILANGLQSIVFTVIWRVLLE